MLRIDGSSESAIRISGPIADFHRELNFLLAAEHDDWNFLADFHLTNQKH